jgi:hypothetical protein
MFSFQYCEAGLARRIISLHTFTKAQEQLKKTISFFIILHPQMILGHPQMISGVQKMISGHL